MKPTSMKGPVHPLRWMILVLFLALAPGCRMPGGRAWIIPVTIDPSDLSMTPEQRERYAERRDQVVSELDGGIVVLRSDGPMAENRHAFRPNNYFFYLTGSEVPGTYMILSERGEPFTLSLPPRSVRSMIYGGEPMDEEQTRALYGPDVVISYPEFMELLDSLLSRGIPVSTDLSDREFLLTLQHRSKGPNSIELRDIATLTDEMRVIKDPMEVERLQKACNITSQALVNVLRACEPGKFEFEMEAILEGTFLQYGSAMPGFPSIVGSGPNSTILHYEANNRQTESGDLLLMDIGAEYGCYTADITRTIPVSGRFSDEQETIYRLVLDAQKRAIELMKPGIPISEGHRVASETMVRGLFDLGLVTDTTAAWQRRFYVLYPSSHYLGLDVHDVGDYGGFFGSFYMESTRDLPESRLLEPGMVLTIEPGLYFRENGLDQLWEIFGQQVDSLEIASFIETVEPVYTQYRNIGVRIEDDILITREGNINLSRYAPREIEDIEQLMR